MPSELEAESARSPAPRAERAPGVAEPTERRGRLAWLRSQGLGLCCGFATVLLLAIGSFVLAATRDGASAHVAMDDLRGFFAPPSWVHLWLYLLVPVAALYAVNALLATWDTVRRRWRAGVRAPAAYGASVVHVGFLLALVAHVAGGFFGGDRGEVLLAEGWQPLPGFGAARLASLDVDALPGGMPRSARARVVVRDGDGGERTATVGWNAPLATAGGARLALLSDLGRVPVAELVSGTEACVLAEGQGCALAGERIEVLRVVTGAVLVRARGPTGLDAARWLGADGELPLAGNRPLQLRQLRTSPAIVVRVREAPGTPWALAAALVLSAGLAMMWRRFAPERARDRA